MAQRIGHRRAARIAVGAITLWLAAGCAQGDATPSGPAWNDGPPRATTSAGGGTPAATGGSSVKKITAVCPLVDIGTVESAFDVKDVRAKEKKPVKVPGGTTYACDFTDGPELFLTVGVAVGPASGSPEANVRAALSNKTGEPLNGIGDAAAYDEEDGIATLAAAERAGSQLRVLVAYGAAGSKDMLVTIAQAVAPKL